MAGLQDKTIEDDQELLKSLITEKEAREKLVESLAARVAWSMLVLMRYMPDDIIDRRDFLVSLQALRDDFIEAGVPLK